MFAVLVCLFVSLPIGYSPQTSGLKSANTEFFLWSPGHAEQLGVVKTPRQWSQPMVLNTDPYGSIVCREIFAQCDEALDKTIKNCKFLKGLYDVL